MTVLAGVKRQILSLAVGRASKKLVATGQVKSAPTYALLEVRAGQTGAFGLQIPSISSQFDKVIALWPNTELPQKLPKNVSLFAATENLVSRWQLLDHCVDGFVFPISLVKPIQTDHVKHLKRHLFAIGGANSVGLLCVDSASAHQDGLNHGNTDLVPMPVLDPDFAILDQRFWKLNGEKFVNESGGVVLAGEALARGFGLFACNHATSVSKFTKRVDTAVTRADVLEMILRNPKLLKNISDSAILRWSQVWDKYGLKTEISSSAEIEEKLIKSFEKSALIEGNGQVLIKKLLGKRRRVRGNQDV